MLFWDRLDPRQSTLLSQLQSSSNPRHFFTCRGLVRVSVTVTVTAAVTVAVTGQGQGLGQDQGQGQGQGQGNANSDFLIGSLTLALDWSIGPSCVIPKHNVDNYTCLYISPT